MPESQLAEKARMAIQRLKSFVPKDGNGYYLAFSGGKDSVVCKALMDMAGVKYDAHYRVTSVDPPELVRFIKDKYPDVHRDVPRYNTERGEDWKGKPITMWNLIPWKLIPPTRKVRYCCQYLKEDGGDGRKRVTGVRWAESASRAEKHGVVTITKPPKQICEDRLNFRMTKQGGVVLVNDNDESRHIIETCYTRNKITINPIVDWEDKDVWDFIKSENIPYCPLYDEGMRRLGCIGCPMASKTRQAEFARWPKYKGFYLSAFDAMLKERERRGKRDATWRLQTAEDVFHWWMEDGVLPGQESLWN